MIPALWVRRVWISVTASGQSHFKIPRASLQRKVVTKYRKRHRCLTKRVIPLILFRLCGEDGILICQNAITLISRTRAAIRAYLVNGASRKQALIVVRGLGHQHELGVRFHSQFGRVLTQALRRL